MTSFDFDVIGDSPKPQKQQATEKPPAEQKPAAEPKADAPKLREKAA